MKRIVRYLDEREPLELYKFKEALKDHKFRQLIMSYWDEIMANPPKLGRWMYCKYCYKNTRPAIFFDGSIYVCTSCGCGLGPIDDYLEQESYESEESI